MTWILRTGSLAAAILFLALCIPACEDNGLVIDFPTPVDSFWWDGFEEQGTNDYVYVLGEYDGDLVAGGLFTAAGVELVNGIGRWNGTSWSGFGDGMSRDDCTGSTCRAWVSALTTFGGDLIAGGRFTGAGGVPAANIARWDGVSWSPLGDGLDDTVFALAEYQGHLLAGGIFTRSGTDSTVSYLAQWNGSAWEAFAGGADGAVRALVVDGTTLIVGGTFNSIGGAWAPFLAAWDGDQWSGFSPYLDGGVQAVQVLDGKLIVGGDFYGVNIGEHGWLSLSHVGMWNGSTWEGLSGFNDDVSALTTYRGRLVSGGAFSYLDGPRNLARWDPDRRWIAFGTGLDRRVASLLEYDGHLYVGGWFRSAGGKPSRYIARWDGD